MTEEQEYTAPAGFEIVAGSHLHHGLIVGAFSGCWRDRFRGKLRPLDLLRLRLLEENSAVQLLRRDETVTLVVRPVQKDADPERPDEESDHAVGFIVFAPLRRVLHLVYVRNKGWRDHGLGTALMVAAFGEPGEPIPTTSVGARGVRCLRRWRLQYEPGFYFQNITQQVVEGTLKRAYSKEKLQALLYGGAPTVPLTGVSRGTEHR